MSPKQLPVSSASGEARQTRRIRWVFGAFVAIAAVLLALEHRAHLLGILPWLFLLACPLMHLFMHHGHGSHGAHHDRPKDGGAQ
ncbi:DUF2933 domain-containing protein [Aromatoleum toluvorans]|uniref:DUF2933 domain-containing protein n=1 Tax=Aromatoleum toluvorans TaxID=92002 RepID=A0ABX1PY94_9RHOO|nr:DUF2933 domain-containing protein [Aromatoleum toluvorans]NMG44416.1 DUF2933 domain-containing protein [Aromatoleum toluvorans]